jgi:hypothetical protein
MLARVDTRSIPHSYAKRTVIEKPVHIRCDLVDIFIFCNETSFLMKKRVSDTARVGAN